MGPGTGLDGRRKFPITWIRTPKPAVQSQSSYRLRYSCCRFCPYAQLITKLWRNMWKWRYCVAGASLKTKGISFTKTSPSMIIREVAAVVVFITRNMWMHCVGKKCIFPKTEIRVSFNNICTLKGLLQPFMDKYQSQIKKEEGILRAKRIMYYRIFDCLKLFITRYLWVYIILCWKSKFRV